jgi:carbon storage regulator
MLCISRKMGESILLGKDIEIQVGGRKGGRIYLGIEAPKDVAIHRKETEHKYEGQDQEAEQVAKSVPQL